LNWSNKIRVSVLFSSVGILLLACQTSTVTNLSKDEIDSQKQFLSQAVMETPYSAVVKHTRVEVVELPEDKFNSKHIFYADVIDTIRGQVLENISYTMLVERGEEAILDIEPVIITLCKDDGYYWPGTGAQFSANKLLLKIAKQNVKTTDTNQ